MIRCQNCGQSNSSGSNFCRFCGSKFDQLQQTNGGNYEMAPPRPYAWKTDEFQIKEQPSARETQQINRVRPLASPQQYANQQIASPPYSSQQQIQPQYQNTLSNGYRCPYCNTNALPIITKKVSPAGWAVFTVLLVTTFILFWIGLLIQEERRICPACKMRVG